jgi:dTDP-4-amino-4,6-dideoxygalactose transaminase
VNEPEIPILDLKPEIDAYWTEYTEAMASVLKSGQFINGPETVAFEKEAAQYLGVKHAIGVNSGTDALVIGLRAMGIGPGDEVITTPFTFYATAEAVSLVGATPIFVDIEPTGFNIDPKAVAEKINARTKAIIPVHLFGQCANMDEILAIADRHGLWVMEDVAQAFGAEYKGKKAGAIGDLGAFSFFPSKNLGAFGDGGLITTDDDQLAEQSKMLRVHGSKKKYYNELVGYNSRLDSVHAAVLRKKLSRIDEFNAGRREAAKRYQEIFQNDPRVVAPSTLPDRTHVFHQYTVRIPGADRDRVQAKMAEKGVSTMVYYPVPVHRLKVYDLKLDLPVAEKAAAEVISLPIWPQITPEIQLRVADALRSSL